MLNKRSKWNDWFSKIKSLPRSSSEQLIHTRKYTFLTLVYLQLVNHQEWAYTNTNWTFLKHQNLNFNISFTINNKCNITESESGMSISNWKVSWNYNFCQL